MIPAIPELNPPACKAWVAQLMDAAEGKPTVAFSRHATMCAHCTGELDAVRRQALWLTGLRQDPDAPQHLLERALAALAGTPPAAAARPKPARRAFLAWSLGGLTAAAGLAIALTVLRPPVHEFDFPTGPTGASGAVDLRPSGSRTTVTFRAAGLQPAASYVVWIALKTGPRIPIGAVNADADGKVTAVLTAEVPFDVAARVWATDAAGVTVLAVPVG